MSFASLGQVTMSLVSQAKKIADDWGARAPQLTSLAGDAGGTARPYFTESVAALAAAVELWSKVESERNGPQVRKMHAVLQEGLNHWKAAQIGGPAASQFVSGPWRTKSSYARRNEALQRLFLREILNLVDEPLHFKSDPAKAPSVTYKQAPGKAGHQIKPIEARQLETTVTQYEVQRHASREKAEQVREDVARKLVDMQRTMLDLEQRQPLQSVVVTYERPPGWAIAATAAGVIVAVGGWLR